MKTITIIIFSLFVTVSTVFADDAVQERKESKNNRQTTQIRDMVRAGVAAEDAEKMARMMKEHRVGNAHVKAASQVVVGTAQKGLPTEPVLNKAFEGLAKQAHGSAIVRAMEKTRSRYEFAYSKAGDISEGKRQTSRLGNTIAEGLAAGLKKEDVDRIMDRVRERIRDQKNKEIDQLTQETFTTARTMSRLGVASPETTEVVCQALQNNFSAEEMNVMQNRFVKQTKSTSASKTANQYGNSIAKGVKAGNLGKSSGNHGNGEHGNKGRGNSSGGHGNGGNGNGGNGNGGNGNGGNGNGGNGNGGNGNGGNGNGGRK